MLTAVDFTIGDGMPGDSPIEARARRALLQMMRSSPIPPPGKAKADYQREWRLRFGTPPRKFAAFWDWAIAKSGALAFSKRGPRGPHRAPRRQK
jgi:hypothetical protein